MAVTRPLLRGRSRDPGLDHTVAIIDEVSDLDPAYDAADIFFLAPGWTLCPTLRSKRRFTGCPLSAPINQADWPNTCKAIPGAVRELCPIWM